MGIENNNPGNIKKGENWEGMVESEGEFVEFESPEYGIRAISKILQTYSKEYKLDNIKKIINRYAPPKENDTKTYIKNMSEFTGFKPTEKLNLEDPETLSKLIKGIIRQENPGKTEDYYSDELVNKSIEMSFGKDEIPETERMLRDSTPTGEVDPGDEENPRTRRDLPPQAITPKDRRLTKAVEMPTKKEEGEVKAVEMPTMKEEGEVKAVEMPTLDDQMDALDFGDLRDAPGSRRIRTATEEKEQKEKMKKATEEGRRVAGEKPDTTTGFESEEYIPSVEMESLDDTMATGDPDFEAEPMGDMQVSATDMDDTPSGDDIFTTFFKSLGDVTFDEGFEVDDLNLKKGGAVEADFDGKDNDDEDEDEGDPPPLAKPEEVADDIPAMLSEGEYVLPANVVRYLGLERIMDMHKKVLHEIQQMEDLGMIQNVDENGKPENDDDEMKFIQPEGKVTETLIIAAKPQGMMCPPEMAEGGQINRDIDIDRTLDDDILNIRSGIAAQRSPTGFKTVFDPEVGFLKIKTPKGNLTMDKGAIDDFINQNEGPEGADPADPGVGGTASSFGDIGKSIQDIIDAELDRAKDLMGGDDDDETMSPGHDVGATDDDQAGDDTGQGNESNSGGGGAPAARGGLMAKFNTGGAVDYNIAGVGTVAGDMQLGDQLAAMEKPKTYEEIRADVLGNPLRDVPDLKENYGYTKSENYIYKDNPFLQGQELQKRKKRSSFVFDPNASGGRDANDYTNDKEVRQLLDMAGIDSEDYAFVMQDYNRGKQNITTQASGGISIKSNERLKKGLDALADKRRILKKGLKASDIPEGATNRDIYKKVFFNELDYFGENLDPDNYELPSVNNPLSVTDAELERLRSGNEAGTLNEAQQNKLAALDRLQLDAPADISTVNRGLSLLSGGKQGTTFYNSRKERLKRLRGPRSGIMGEGQYVEGVGYVT